jgi:hypothetical protein
MIKVTENKSSICYYDADYQLIVIEWKDVTFTFEEYKFPFEAGLDYQLKNNLIINNFLSDVRNQKVVAPQFRKWFQDVAIKRAMSQGLKRAAVVMSNNVFKKYYINNIFNTTKTFGLPLKAFNSIDDAKKWFSSFAD